MEDPMPPVFETAPATSAIPITFATKTTWDAISAGLSAQARQFGSANGFAAKPGKCLILPAPDGQIAQVIFGLEDEGSKSRDLFRAGTLPGLLPAGVYRFANAPHDTRLAVLAFALGRYRFGRYRKTDAPDVRLVPPDGIDTAEIVRMAEAATLARDLINMPSNDMGPAELAQAAKDVATRFGARFDCIIGDDLVTRNFPLIHAVGQASSRAPRLIELNWGDPAHPNVTLVGKGVRFDTGGPDLKPASRSVLIYRPFTPGMRSWRGTWPLAQPRRTIRCGACRCGRLTIAGSTPRSRPSPTRRRARLPARSPARCSCSASSNTPEAGCISISTAGRRRRSPRAPRAVNAGPRARSTDC